MTVADWMAIRRRCACCAREIERRVGIPNPWSVNEFLDRLERYRGRNIDLCAVAWAPGASTGAWRRHDDHDVIAYAANTSPWHQDLIILHEVGHLLFGHRGQCVLSIEQAQRLAPDLQAAAFAHLLDRVGSAVEEHEAEVLATMILTRVAAQPRRRGPRDGWGDLADRIQAAFG